MGARFLGPAQLVAWLVGGILAAVIALAFVQCAALYPQVGGTYAYARAAFGPLAGFLAGWALYAGEWVALPVFPLAFVNYLSYFLPGLSGPAALLVKALLVGAVTAVNVYGVRASGRANDVLTLAKLVPLALLILAGLALLVGRTDLATRHLTPFTPLGWGGFGSAVLLIFWAYAGFELAVLPAREVRQPGRTLPRGLILGMLIATIFYLLTSLAVVVALPWQTAAASPRPLADALVAILASFGLPIAAGAVLMSLGGLVSILGVYDVFNLCVARLSYAMATDGLFPAPFARLHGERGTPYVGLLFQAATALAISAILDLTNLISIAVFFLGLCYVATALAALRLLGRAPAHRLHVPALRGLLVLAALGGVYLSLQAPAFLIVLGLGVMLVGLAPYLTRRSAWGEAAEVAAAIRQDERDLARWLRARETWLMRSLRRLADDGR
jgi:amino acid transporter